MRVEAAEDLIGDADGPEGVLAGDAGDGVAPYGRREVFELQGEGLAAGRLDLVDPEDLAEQVLLDLGRLGEVDPVEVEAAGQEGVGRPHDGGLLGGDSGAAKGAAIGGAAGTGAVLATRGNEVELAAGAEMAPTLASPVEVEVR